MRRLDPEELARQKARLRVELEQRAAQARADVARRRELLEARRAGQPRQSSWRRWVGIGLLIAILLLLCLGLPRCEPEPPPPEELPAPAPAPVEAEPSAGGRAVPRLQTPRRPDFPRVQPPAVPWLDAFRLQVAARAPRLAACFVGADHPGTLRWTAAVEPLSGRVSDAELEPLLDRAQVTRAQRDCVLLVLSEPTYRLEGGDGRGTPSRVSIVLEF